MGARPFEVVARVLPKRHLSRLPLALRGGLPALLATLGKRAPTRLVVDAPPALVVPPEGFCLERPALLLVDVPGAAHVV